MDSLKNENKEIKVYYINTLLKKGQFWSLSLHQKSIIHVSYDSLRPKERAGTKKYCNKFLSYIDPFDNCERVI